MKPDRKRSRPSGDQGPEQDRSKRSKDDRSGYKLRGRWRYGPEATTGIRQATTIHPGDQGIFVTCHKGREGKGVQEVRDLFFDYADRLYGDQLDSEAKTGNDDDTAGDIEAEIQAELEDLEKPTRVPLFENVTLDTQCILFLRTRAPVEPVSFVEKICDDAMTAGIKRTRVVQRLAPMSMFGKATREGLEKAATAVLAPHFHGKDCTPKRYAIRPNMRHSRPDWDRDSVIRQVADLVGPGHKVDLKNYELLILIESYKNIVGISVVSDKFEAYKRFNLAELHDISRRHKEDIDRAQDEQTEVSTSEQDPNGGRDS